MPNLITIYNNGTFEVPAVPISGSFVTIDNTFARTGVQSGKVVLINSLGHPSNLDLIEFPATVGQIYKVEAWVRTSSANPASKIGIILAPGLDEYELLDYQVTDFSKANLAWSKISVTFKVTVLVFGKAYVNLHVIDGVNIQSGTGSNLVDTIASSLSTPVTERYTNGDTINIDDLYGDVVTAPSDSQFGGRKLYYVKNVFYLSDGSNLYTIEEPIGWDKILINITFDTTIRGFKFEFTDKDATLEFDEACGKPILDKIFNEQGVDGVAGLKFGEMDENGVVEILYEAKINFDNCSSGQYTFKALCERISLATKFAARFDTKFELEQSTTLSGKINLPTLNPVDCFLHSTELNKYVKSQYNKGYNIDEVITPTLENFGAPTSPDVFTFIPPLRFINSDIEGLTEPTAPNGLLLYAGYSLPLNKAFIKLTFSIKVAFEFDLTANSGGWSCGFRVYKLSGIAKNGGEPLMPLYPLTGDVNSDFITLPMFPSGRINFAGQVNGGIELFSDEALFIKCFVYKPNAATGNISNIKFSNETYWAASFQDLSPTFASNFLGYRLHDVIERMVLMVTDTPNSFKSDFLKSVCAYNNIVASGKQVRKIPNGKFQSSLKSVITSVDALFNVGMTFERDNNGNEFARLEQIQYFFRDIELLKLDTISSYKYYPASDLIFNELEFGFTKFPQGNETDSAADFMTKHNYLTLIQSVKGKLTKLCEFLLSPYYIEYAKQNSYRYNSTGQYETDNDIFLISTKGAQASEQSTGVFDAVNRKVTFDKILPILEGDTIVISGTVNNNGSKFVLSAYSQTVNGVSSPTTTVIFRSDVTVVNETVLATVNYVQRFIPKRDEQFETVEGVYSKLTVYNLEHHIKRIFYRWSNYFSASMLPTINTVGSFVRFLSGSNNVNVSTKLKSTETCTLDSYSPYRVKKDNENEATINLARPIFKPYNIDFKCPLTWNTLNTMRKAFEGRHPDGKDYGYIRVLTPDGTYKKGFLVDLKFHPVTLEATITLKEKYDG